MCIFIYYQVVGLADLNESNCQNLQKKKKKKREFTTLWIAAKSAANINRIVATWLQFIFVLNKLVLFFSSYTVTGD